MSVTMGGFILLVIAKNGGVYLSSTSQNSDSIGTGPRGFLKGFWLLILIDLGFLWTFVILMVPGWSILSHKVIAIALAFFWFAFSSVRVWIVGLSIYNE